MEYNAYVRMESLSPVFLGTLKGAVHRVLSKKSLCETQLHYRYKEIVNRATLYQGIVWRK